ncbi:MAG: hypothetical protein ACSLE4_01770 [Methyloceanibacter sp.]|uniref:hypothetical protein n=1 Tax=Methyloceanibacter sp. TaxID=1965321 RepID=UPI003EE3FC97
MGSTWAVDLADTGAVYPWQGYELIMVIVGVALWILWHIIQLRDEKVEYAEDVRLYGNKESIERALDDHPI